MKVITFSRVFPVYHPRKGEPTGFVEKILSGEKVHTIRAGNRWKKGELFSPRIWSGKPYASKQECISNPLDVKNIWTFELNETGAIFINGKFLSQKTLDSRLSVLAKNDGLSILDLCYWFKKPFTGQIICWNENINY